MKKKIVNGILLVAMLFATTSAFVSCKDTDSDVKAELDAKYAALEKKFNDLQTLVEQVKCKCDGKYYTKEEIDQKVTTLNTAIGDVKKLIPSLEGYLKTADLPNEIKTILADYYTKAYVDETFAKKSEIPEIPEPQVVDLTDYFTKTEVADLIALKLEGYVKTGDIPEIDLSGYVTTAKLNEMLEGYAKTGEYTNLTEKKIKDWINDALDKYVPQIEFPETLDKNDVIEIIETYIENLTTTINNVYTTMVTSITVDQVSNQMISFISPLGIKANILLSFFGDQVTRDIYFPIGTEEPVVYAGEWITGGTGNAGKLYVTVNPSSWDFTGKTLKLVSTDGKEGPVELTELQPSTKKLMFLSRGNDNAFYEMYATIPQEKIAKAYVTWEPTDVSEWKDDIKSWMKNRDKMETIEMINKIYNLIAGRDIPAYRLQAAWGEGDVTNYTYSEANIAALAIKPLSYSFDLATEYEYDGTNTNALERFEKKVVYWAAKGESTRSKIFHFLDRFNTEASKLLENINWSLQPTLLVEQDNAVTHPDVYDATNTFTRYDAGKVTLMPTSWSAELFAPAFLKYVAVVEVDGSFKTPDDDVNEGLLGQVIPGSVNEIPFNIEPGKTYKIQYSALDYAGNIRTLYYVIKGNDVD